MTSEIVNFEAINMLYLILSIEIDKLHFRFSII